MDEESALMGVLYIYYRYAAAEKVVCCLGCKELLVELSGNKEGFTKEHVGGRLRGKSTEGNRKEENVELRNKMPNLKFYDFHNSFFLWQKHQLSQ